MLFHKVVCKRFKEEKEKAKKKKRKEIEENVRKNGKEK